MVFINSVISKCNVITFKNKTIPLSLYFTTFVAASRPDQADLNQMDCKIWDLLQDRVYQMKVENIEDLERTVKMLAEMQ